MKDKALKDITSLESKVIKPNTKGKLINSILNTGINKEIIIDKKLKNEVAANNSIVDINH